MKTQLIFAFDINDTITLLNEVDEQKKDIIVPLSQLVCQITPHRKHDISVEEHIRKIIPDKAGQRNEYVRFVQEGDEDVKKCFEDLKEEWEKCVLQNHSLFFSFTNAIRYIKYTYPDAIILLHSFGKEIDFVLRKLGRMGYNAFPDISKTSKLQNDEGFVNEVNQMFSGGVFGWKNSYKLWKTQGIGKPLFYHHATRVNYIDVLPDDQNEDCGCVYGVNEEVEYKTIFFDDNASLCAYPVGKSIQEVKDCIIDVDTTEALLDPEYFVRKIRQLNI